METQHFTDEDPVTYMRKKALQNAIETVLNQQEYVTNTDDKIGILQSIIYNLEGRRKRVIL